MKTLTSVLCAALVAGFAFAATAADKVQHVVCLKFKSTATAQQIKQVETEFAALKQKIKEIKSLEWGTNVSPENLNDGFTHCFIVTFKSASDRDAYIVHPAHKEFVKILGPVLDKPFVIDFVPQK